MMLFGELALRFRLYCEMMPANLARQFLQDAYKLLCEQNRDWSWLRAESQIIIQNSRTGTCSLTFLDATVTPVAPTTFSAADVGRQIRFNQMLPLTILSYDATTGTVELDRPWGGATAASTSFVILDAYATMPADFGSFVAVLDPVNAWRLLTDITEEELNTWDAKRSSSSTPLALCSRRLSAAGLIQYEVWPYPLTQRQYPMYYYKRAQDLTDDDVLPGPLSQRADILEAGAMWRLAEWPGTADTKNPYFNLGLAERKEAQFRLMVHELELRDQDVYLTWLETVSRITRMPWAPIDSNFLQSHDDAYYHTAVRHW